MSGEDICSKCMGPRALAIHDPIGHEFEPMAVEREDRFDRTELIRSASVIAAGMCAYSHPKHDPEVLLTDSEIASVADSAVGLARRIIGVVDGEPHAAVAVAVPSALVPLTPQQAFAAFEDHVRRVADLFDQSWRHERYASSGPNGEDLIIATTEGHEASTDNGVVIGCECGWTL